MSLNYNLQILLNNLEITLNNSNYKEEEEKEEKREENNSQNNSNNNNNNNIRNIQINKLKIWFDDNRYLVTFPFNQIFQCIKYFYEMKLENKNEVKLHSKIPSDILYNYSYLLSESIENLALKLTKLELLANNCMVIKYKDGINQQWSEPWNIESRSPVCIYINNQWKVITAMPRGPEVAGDKEHNITKLQDVNINDEKSILHFAPHYQTIIKSLKGDVEESQKIHKIICSSKRDGLCFRVFSYDTLTLEGQFFIDAIQHISDSFVQLFVNTSQKYIQNRFLIPASNGTAFTTNIEVQYWIACSIAISYGITHRELLQYAKQRITPTDILLLPLPENKNQRFLNNNIIISSTLNLIEAFVIDILNVDIHLNQLNNHSTNRLHAWEALGGPNRMCAFDHSPHTELACSYTEDQCGISYLGYSQTLSEGDMEWIPHFDIIHPFPEPLYWILNNVSDCNNALRYLGYVFSGKNTWDDFYLHYQPSNRNLENTFNPDPEGFVTYFLIENFNSKLSYIYCKTKTWMYYSMHNIRVEDIPLILTMPQQFGQAFPAYYKIQSFFSEHSIENITQLVRELREFVWSEEMKSDLSEKALSGLRRVNQPNVAFKIILNNSKNVWKYGSIKIASKYFPEFSSFESTQSSIENELVTTTNNEESKGIETNVINTNNETKTKIEELSSLLRALLMDLQCYNDNWEENIKNEFNYLKIKETKQLSTIVSKLWNFIYKQ